jgi:prepilin-type N-terminal cleavage/methylation domain-containing protein
LNKSHKKAFTLIELMVAIVLSLILINFVFSFQFQFINELEKMKEREKFAMHSYKLGNLIMRGFKSSSNKNVPGLVNFRQDGSGGGFVPIMSARTLTSSGLSVTYASQSNKFYMYLSSENTKGYHAPFITTSGGYKISLIQSERVVIFKIKNIFLKENKKIFYKDFTKVAHDSS